MGLATGRIARQIRLRMRHVAPLALAATALLLIARAGGWIGHTNHAQIPHATSVPHHH